MRKSRNKKLCLTALALLLAASGVFTVLGSKNAEAEDRAVAKSAGSALNEEYSASDYAAKIGKSDGATGLQDKTFTVNDVKNETFSLETPKKEGYSFGGWYLDVKKIDDVSRLPLSDVTLYGAFTKERKKITFVTDGGEGTVNLYGDDFGAYVPEKDGYVFDGWVTETGEKANIGNLENGAKVYAKFVKESEIFSETASNPETKIGAEIVDGEILGAYKIGVPEIIAFALAGGGLAAMIYALTAFFKKSKSKGE